MDMSPVKLMALAKEISEAYLAGGVPLNDSLTKISEENELSVPQIQRIAEIANHETNLQLLKRSEDKTFVFPLADAQEVAKRIRSGDMPKVAALDIIAAVTAPVKALEKTAEAPRSPADVYPATVDDCRIRNVNLLLSKIASRVKAYKSELGSQLMAAREDVEEVMHKIGALAKEHIILNNGQLSDFLKYACGYDPDNAGLYQQVFTTLKEDLMKLGAPVDRALICDDLKMPDSTLEVSNGGHILAIHLDTLKNKISAEDRIANRIKLLGTFGAAIVDQIHALKTQKDYSDYMEQTLDNLEKKASAGLDEFLDFLAKESAVAPVGGAFSQRHPFTAKYGPGLAGFGVGAGLGLAGGVAAKAMGRGVGKELTKEHDEREQLEELATRRKIY